MSRDITTEDGTEWNLIEAHAGLKAAGLIEPGAYAEVVATPRGGAQTVRLKLPAAWETTAEDAELAKAIDAARQG